MNQKQLHPVQAEILKVLLYKPEARFSDLNTLSISSDHFTFHVKKLIDGELIVKTEQGNYQLTSKGKEFANRFDTDGKEVVLEKQAKLGVLIGCVSGTGRERKYLMQQRLKQPY